MSDYIETVKDGDWHDSKTWNIDGVKVKKAKTREVRPHGLILKFHCAECGQEMYFGSVMQSILSEATWDAGSIHFKVYANCLCTKCLYSNKVIIKEFHKEADESYV